MTNKPPALDDRCDQLDVQLYIHLPWTERFSTLTSFIGITGDKTCKITGTTPVELQKVLNRIGGDDTAIEQVRRLFSVLAFVRRLSRNHPKRMVSIWNEKGRYSSAVNAPPWDEAGMSEYLEGGGPVALKEALFWIRGH